MTAIDEETNLLRDPSKLDSSFKGCVSVFIGMTIFLGSIWYLFVYTGDKKLNSESKYTIGTVTKVEGVLDGDPMASFFYSVNNKMYKGVFTIFRDDRISWKSGTKVFVKFYPPDPNIATVVFDNFVNDTLKTIPISGWTKLP